MAGSGSSICGAGRPAAASILYTVSGSLSKVAVTRSPGAVAVISRATGFSVAVRAARAGPACTSMASVVPNSQLGQDSRAPGAPR